ncbi:Gfo/Idh/MocA family oxidoreductase [Candidatus Poribacteria bacterium]|nr:Gfo/Idh/MocA family oxidoreductase [Candidatus Poribacteria bacterium]
MSQEILRVGVAGCGGLGRTEAKIVHDLDGVELVGVCDVVLANAKQAAADLGIEKAYSNHRQLIEENDLDCLVVVTPTYTHAEVTVDAANAGLHVFCEKPMAITLQECDKMLAAAERNNVKLMIGFVRRFQPNYREMKKRVDAGAIGAVRLVQSVRMGGRPPVGIGEWRRERRKVGGLHSAYIHEMDQLLWLGGDVKTVRGVANFGTLPDTDVEDSIWMCLEFANGAIGALGASEIYPIGWYELGVGGTEGAMKIAGGTTAIILKKHSGDSETIELEPNDAFVEELSHFFACVRNDQQPLATGMDGRRSLEVVMAAFKSAETGQVVTLPM